MYRRFLFIVLGSISAAAAADVHIIEEIVAKVNNDIITKGELARVRMDIEAELRQQGATGPKLNDALREKSADALRDQIDQLLLVQKAKDLNINVDGEISKRLAAMQVQSKITDDDKFHDFIREQMGMSFEDFKQQAKNSLLTQQGDPAKRSARASSYRNRKSGNTTTNTRKTTSATSRCFCGRFSFRRKERRPIR